MIVPGGGIALGGQCWVSSQPAFLLPVRVLGKLFRRLFLTRLIALHDAGRLAFFGSLAPLADRQTFLRHLSPARRRGTERLPLRRIAAVPVEERPVVGGVGRHVGLHRLPSLSPEDGVQPQPEVLLHLQAKPRNARFEVRKALAGWNETRRVDRRAPGRPQEALRPSRQR